ncbi:TPA: hypothetical protein ACH3X3_001280 [Trebouxia sp. C0006]
MRRDTVGGTSDAERTRRASAVMLCSKAYVMYMYDSMTNAPCASGPGRKQGGTVCSSGGHVVCRPVAAECHKNSNRTQACYPLAFSAALIVGSATRKLPPLESII